MKAQDLKNSILQLAIQGKLVPQDANDEPAEVLYAKIQAEKQKLIKESKIKKDKPLPPITDDEIPFEIPSTWKWVRLSDIVYSVPTKEYQILQSEILDNGKYPVVSQSQQLIEGYSNKVEKLYKHEKPVLIFGDHTRCLKLIDFNFVVGADGVKILCPFRLDEKYLYYAIQYFIINMTNRGYSRHFQFIKDKEIPLPPLAEQKRIVAKIEELEPLVKQYDKAETELSVLNDSFPEQLKKSILQYAIQGKLVPQDANDEPAEVLYAKIQAEKQKLIKEGKIKKDKPLPPITDEEIPFTIPPSWKWVRFGDIVRYTMGKTPSRNDYEMWGKGYQWVSIADLIDGKTIFETKEQISQKSYNETFKGNIIPAGTLLMSFKLTIGKVSILGFDGFHNEAIISIFPYIDIEKIITMYLFKLLPYLTIFSTETKTAVKGTTLNSDSLSKLLIPLPPLAEQKRIVTKVNELMQYCEKLK